MSDTESCGDACPGVFGQKAVSCTLPKGHAVHRSPRFGTTWERLCDEVVQRADALEAERDALKAAIAEAAGCWPDLNALRRLRAVLAAPEAPGGES
jgi:hypothetical protein